MKKNFGPKTERGVSIAEVLIIVSIILIFLIIVIADFPKIMRQHALNGATYKLAQDLRRVVDYALSGAQFNYYNTVVPAKGYGIFFGSNDDFYVIYADVGSTDIFQLQDINYKYDGDVKSAENIEARMCKNSNMAYNISMGKTRDCILEVVDIKKESSSLSFKGITVGVKAGTDEAEEDIKLNEKSYSVNFSPPNPQVYIKDDVGISYLNGIEIFLKNSDGVTKSVFVNTSGLITIK